MIVPSIGLSNRKKIPAFKILGRTFTPMMLIRTLRRCGGWTIKDGNGPVVTLDVGGQIIRLTKEKAGTMLIEWPDWLSYYLPRFSLEGKTVLDIGAGSGETALLFLKSGAKKVVCVEPREDEAELIRENAERNRWPVEVINGPFSLSQVTGDIDFIKSDCEGCEAEFLKLNSLPAPASMEVHGKDLTDQFIAKFHMRLLKTSPKGFSILAT